MTALKKTDSHYAPQSCSQKQNLMRLECSSKSTKAQIRLAKMSWQAVPKSRTSGGERRRMNDRRDTYLFGRRGTC